MWTDSLKPFCTAESDLDDFAAEIVDEKTSSFITRASGKAKGREVWGSGIELGGLLVKWS